MLREYGYSDQEIRGLETRMMALAYERIAPRNRPFTLRNGAANPLPAS